MSESISFAVDRTGWESGPWDQEPDRLEWRAHGLPCLIVRSGRLNVLCGYVAVPPGHPSHGVYFREVHARAHDGLTYSDSCHGRICHVPEAGEPPDVWWLGFDCGRAGDKAPGAPEPFPFYISGGDDFPSSDGVYRDLAYVRGEVERLAEQLAAMARVSP